MLFRYPLFLHSLRPRPLFRYYLFLLGKNKDGYSDILYFYLTQIETSSQISSVPTRPKLLFKFPLFLLGKNQDGYSDILYFCLEKIRTSIQMSLISAWHKSGLLIRYPLFLPGLRPRQLFKYPQFLIGKNHECYSYILYLNLT